jgi:hypothetical protein
LPRRGQVNAFRTLYKDFQLMSRNSVTDQVPGHMAVIPYRAWWGLFGCAAFMGLIFAFAPYSDGIEFLPRKHDFWYPWQLPDATVWTRLSAWVPYTVHQVAIWFLIARARQARPKYIFGLHRFNVWALGINAFFLVLHVAQTKLFYDGLAQDVHESTAFGSVTLMLFLIMLMENRRRGLFLGYRIPQLTTAGDTVRRYHGYYFSWAIIYTFWYHPIEMTPGHLAGFAYMSMLLLQSSLFFTRYHTNRWWTMFLEVSFALHGALVAWYIMNQGEHAFWSMFAFGGVMTFLLVQLHGLGLSRPRKWVLAAPFIAVLVIFYGIYPEYLIGLFRIPLIMYIGTFVMFVIVWAMMYTVDLFRRA